VAESDADGAHVHTGSVEQPEENPR
jgi:hypothetical protein